MHLHAFPMWQSMVGQGKANPTENSQAGRPLSFISSSTKRRTKHTIWTLFTIHITQNQSKLHWRCSYVEERNTRLVFVYYLFIIIIIIIFWLCFAAMQCRRVCWDELNEICKKLSSGRLAKKRCDWGSVFCFLIIWFGLVWLFNMCAKLWVCVCGVYFWWYVSMDFDSEIGTFKFLV